MPANLARRADDGSVPALLAGCQAASAQRLPPNPGWSVILRHCDPLEAYFDNVWPPGQSITRGSNNKGDIESAYCQLVARTGLGDRVELSPRFAKKGPPAGRAADVMVWVPDGEFRWALQDLPSGFLARRPYAV